MLLLVVCDIGHQTVDANFKYGYGKFEYFKILLLLDNLLFWNPNDNVQKMSKNLHFAKKMLEVALILHFLGLKFL